MFMRGYKPSVNIKIVFEIFAVVKFIFKFKILSCLTLKKYVQKILFYEIHFFEGYTLRKNCVRIFIETEISEGYTSRKFAYKKTKNSSPSIHTPLFRSPPPCSVLPPLAATVKYVLASFLQKKNMYWLHFPGVNFQ